MPIDKMQISDNSGILWNCEKIWPQDPYLWGDNELLCKNGYLWLKIDKV